MKCREIVLRARPSGMPRESDFDVVERDVAEPDPGQVLVRNLFLSVDPYQRNRMRAGLTLGGAIPARSVGRVVASRHEALRNGDLVFLGAGAWAEAVRVDGGDATPLDPELAPPQIHLGVAGVPGLTAYVGLLDHGRPQAGQTVFVSAAAGAVGSLACQIAKLAGCRVVGSAGSDEKVGWLLREARVDAAINYRTCGDLAEAMRRHCPEGIDVLFECVGGAQLDAAVAAMRPHGRIVLCGLVASINATGARPGLADLDAFIMKRLALRGFVVTDHLDRKPAFHADLKRWLARGEVRWRETIVDGLVSAPGALIRLLEGGSEGKMLV
ncbi:MAG: NADP-dependent oxidoreductase, partial [Burkholderiales bacterium]|nr:NADP-dependent oxidoreductase [Burkholderiales bacterium]